MAGTKQPSGLGIERTAVLTFKFTWKIADKDYGKGQQLRWHTDNAKPDKWKTEAISATATSKKVSLTAASYYPTKNAYVKKITFQVRGKRNTSNGTSYDWSAWSEKSITLVVPLKPTLSAALDSSLDNVTKFTWTTDVDNTKGTRPFVNNQLQSIRVRASNVTDGSKLKWNSSQPGWISDTPGANSSRTITEDPLALANDSYTRWVRIRSRGSAGASEWRYAKHVYATPYPATISKTSAVESSSGITTTSVQWTATSDAAHPIDKVTVQWVIDTPDTGMACPGNANWQDGPELRDTSGADKATFAATSSIGTDEAMWVRIMTTHDRKDAYSLEKIVNVGKLATPSALSVSADPDTFRATVTATNGSTVPDSALAVVFRSTSIEPFIVGIITSGSTTVQCPDWSADAQIDFGVYAFQGTYTAVTRADGVDEYAVDANMTSDTLWENGTLPQSPASISAETTTTPGEALLTWDWPWADADVTEISWSDNINAWESTDEPQTYTVTNLHSGQWRVSGLTSGQVWYFRLRLGQTGDNTVTYSPYSAPVAVDMSSAPSVPVLTLSEGVIPQEGSVTASWAYVSTDGTQQAFAEVCEVTVVGTTYTYGSIIANAQGEQHVTISAEEAGWTIGNYYYLAVRVKSDSNRVSGWSDPVPVLIAEPVTCTITQTSLASVSVTDDDGEVRTVTALTAMPLTATITGAGEGGTTTLVVERRQTFLMDRPDESVFNGYEGETIVTFTQFGEDQIEITRDMLIGSLDQGAEYRLIATVTDTYGQTDSQSIDFQVIYSHSAIEPEGTVTIDTANLVAVIEPVAPVGWQSGDTCDVYRLSQDTPVKVLEDADFGTKYVDPYPTIGSTGGYRFVYMTEDGSYITSDEQFAWLDVEAGLPIKATVIDFGGQRVVLEHDMDVSHNWEKDFTETTYLGGAVQGDWNLSVHRGVSLNADSVIIDNPDLITSMRRLAAYTGICHVRTVDGSTFAADVQVSEDRSYSTAGKIASFSVTIRQVDPQQLEGIEYDDWVTP